MPRCLVFSDVGMSKFIVRKTPRPRQEDAARVAHKLRAEKRRSRTTTPHTNARRAGPSALLKGRQRGTFRDSLVRSGLHTVHLGPASPALASCSAATRRQRRPPLGLKALCGRTYRTVSQPHHFQDRNNRALNLCRIGVNPMSYWKIVDFPISPSSYARRRGCRCCL